MTDFEYNLLDELYFIKTFDELQKLADYNEIDLLTEIWNLVEKKWVKILDKLDNELELNKQFYKEHHKSLRFNITKQGLLAHNQI